MLSLSIPNPASDPTRSMRESPREAFAEWPFLQLRFGLIHHRNPCAWLRNWPLAEQIARFACPYSFATCFPQIHQRGERDFVVMEVELFRYG